jgi:Zn-dependent protease with chaperone function/uncharacterized protein YraI
MLQAASFAALTIALLQISIARAHADDAPAMSFHGVAFTRALTYQSTTEAKSVVDKIMNSIGIDQSKFEILESPDVPNAAAWIQGNRRIIGYNKKFMAGVLKSSGRDYYSLIGVMAHEIGHHLAGHTIYDLSGVVPAMDTATISLRNALAIPAQSGVRTVGDLAELRRDELSADKFSGYILRKLGASAAEATIWMEQVPDPGANSTHPRPKERVAAILAGWKSAGGASVVVQDPKPATAAQEDQMVSCRVVAPDDLKIRAGAGTNFAQIYSMPRDAQGVDVNFSSCQTSGSERWCFVSYQQYQGWSNVRFLGGCSDRATVTTVGNGTSTCDVVGVPDDLKMRTQAGRAGAVVFALPSTAKGVEVDQSSCQSLPREGTWCFASYEDYTGWVYQGYLGNCR